MRAYEHAKNVIIKLVKGRKEQEKSDMHYKGIERFLLSIKTSTLTSKNKVFNFLFIFYFILFFYINTP